jgi:hypothetical protein
MSRLSVSAYVEFHQHTNRTFDPYMPVVIIGALAGGVALAVMYGVHSIPGQLAAAGAVCYALVIIIGVPTYVRINHQIASWSIQNPPREWAQTRARWIRFHVGNTRTAVLPLSVSFLTTLIRNRENLAGLLQQLLLHFRSRATYPCHRRPPARAQADAGRSSIRSRSEDRNRCYGSCHGAPAHWGVARVEKNMSLLD